MAKKKFKTKDQIIRDIELEGLRKKILSIDSEAFDYDVYEDINLIKKKVKLNIEGYDKRIKDGELSEDFILWYNKNKDKTFIVRSQLKVSDLSPYRLYGVTFWLFDRYDLILVKED